jgi:OmpA-OmpF porin, OOP family
MHHARTRLIALAIVAALSACDRGADGQPTAPAADADRTAAVGEGAGVSGEDDAAQPAAAAAPATAGDDVLLDKEGVPVTLAAFDRNDVAEAPGAPGALPVFSLPRGYTTREGPQVLAFARFPFRLGDGLHWVEGASWSTRIGVDDDAFPDKDYSPLEVRRNLEAVLEQAGAKRVFEGPLRRDLYYGSLADEIGDGFIEAVNYGADTPTSVYVIRHGERTVWIQLTFDSHATGVMAVEERPFEATARWSDDFPHLSLPPGYELRNRELRRDYDAFPFWTGAAFEEIEGKTYAADFGAEEETYSMHEVRRNLEAMMDDAGGVLVHAGPVPKEASESIPFERKSPYGNAAGYSWHQDDRGTWRVDLDDGRQVWIHARLDPRAAGWVVVEREGFQQTSSLLEADALKAKIDADGRVAIEVNFAVDAADILPDSQPQLAQVLELMRADPGLRLAVEGHTDGSGDPAHNQSLSGRRAAAVVAELTRQGIDASRLASAGYGATRPVASNADDAGKARNRRVELVRL